MKSEGLIFILLLLCAPAPAATVLVAGLPTTAAQPVLDAIHSLKDAPPNWQIIVVNEKIWAKYMARVDHTSQLAITDRRKQITIVRGAAVTDLNLTGHYVTVKHILAHELGHLYLDTDDEWRAEVYAAKHD